MVTISSVGDKAMDALVLEFAQGLRRCMVG